MHEPDSKNGASGFVCPRCGGALWERDDGESKTFECRIGDTFEATQLWIEHCAIRNRAVLTAARAIAENAALARKLAAWARERGTPEMAPRLDEEADFEDRAYQQVRQLLDGLDEPEREPIG